jgi:hypothetical protein
LRSVLPYEQLMKKFLRPCQIGGQQSQQAVISLATSQETTFELMAINALFGHHAGFK